MLNYHYILFDADNTLFDFDQAEQSALIATLQARGYPAGEAYVNLYLSINRALWAQFERGEVSRQQLVVERFARFLAAVGGGDDPEEMNRDYLARLGEQPCLLPGAQSLCRALVPRYTMAIVTNGIALAQRGRFSRSPLRELIPYLFISEEIGFQKPQPQFFEAVLQAMSIPDRRQVLVVGDSLVADIQGGKAAGLDTVWFNPKRLPPSLDITPTYEVDGFPALSRLLLAPVSAG